MKSRFTGGWQDARSTVVVLGGKKYLSVSVKTTELDLSGLLVISGTPARVCSRRCCRVSLVRY